MFYQKKYLYLYLPLKYLNLLLKYLNLPLKYLALKIDKNDRANIFYIDDIQKYNKINYLKKDFDVKLNDWETIVNEGSIISTYSINKKNKSMNIRAQYDKYLEDKYRYLEDKYPHSLLLEINNYSDINIRINIKNIIGTSEYNMCIMNEEGFNLFINNIEFMNKFNLVIEGIKSFIPLKRKEKIIEKIIKKFSNIQNTNQNNLLSNP